MLKHLIKFLWFLLTVISILAGIIGLLLPIVPQVPFFLLFFYSLSKFSPRFHNYITNTKLYKKYVDGLIDFVQKKQANVKNSKKSWFQNILTFFSSKAND